MKKFIRYLFVILLVFSIGFIFGNPVKKTIAENKAVDRNENIEDIGIDIANLAIDTSNPEKITDDNLKKLDQKAKVLM